MNTRKPLFFFVTAVVPFALLGCETEPASPQSGGPALSIGTVKPSESPSASNPVKSSKPRPKDDQIAKMIQKDLDKSFGFKGTEPEWYLSIKKIEVEGNKVKVRTNLVKNEIFNEFISQTCGGVSTFVYSSANTDLGLEEVEVYGENGDVLVLRRRVSDSCQP